MLAEGQLWKRRQFSSEDGRMSVNRDSFQVFSKDLRFEYSFELVSQGNEAGKGAKEKGGNLQDKVLEKAE